MRTQLGTYCQQFDGTLRPVLQDLDVAIQAIDQGPRGVPAHALQPSLLELQHQLKALCDKVAEQQAYVLIFGPLKSGKSTLMNAIAASYVSEVSSLPAYPCLVFVRAGKEREYVVTCYDGSERRHRDTDALHQDIQKAHTELADAIRTAEQRNLTFDPQEHYPQAIRRVDVHVPDSQLERTGAVLVDTPGLYTRMRFGYDRMTRDFRDAAACAIFVVKSDTLFLEQVFAEFQQLLDLFSRIFLVVNVDSTKRDLSPDGRLIPSLEQSRPEEVLKAFEQLAMSAPLLEAARDGRVRMYPVDLLHAASDVLSRKAGGGDTSRIAAQGFKQFEQDLGDFLASSEYLSAFLRDSLQRGYVLLGELTAQLQRDEVKHLQNRIVELDEQRSWTTAEQKRLQRALELDWSAAFARLQREVAAEVERAARDHGAKLLRTLGASIDTWFLSSHSLEWLVRGQWGPLVRDYREAVHAAGRAAFQQHIAQVEAGLDLPDRIADLASRAGINLRQLLRESLESLGPVEWPQKTTVPVDVREFPIRKGVLDRLAFRSQARVRERLFGSPDKPDHKVPGKDKARHLGEPGRLYLHQCVAQFRGELLPKTIAALGAWFGSSLFEAASLRLQQGLSAYGPLLGERLQSLDAERVQLVSVHDPLQQLAQLVDSTTPKLEALETQFAREATLVPQPKDVVLAPKAPAVAEPDARKRSKQSQ